MSDSAQALNCSPQDEPIDADADIVGPGVLAAFLISSALTVAAVVFGYLSGSLGDESMSNFDRAIIRSARIRGRSVIRWLRRIFNKTTNSPPVDQELQPRSDAWKQSVSRFILALSDQQLVTGMAILVSGVANQRTLTVWEFQVVLSLAWFSTTSHLATLDALRTYLKAQSVVRNIRVFGMLVVLVLLLYTFGLSMAATFYPAGGNTFPIQCVLEHRWNLRDPSRYSAFIPVLLSWGIALLFVVTCYYRRISDLYWGHWLPPVSPRELVPPRWRQPPKQGTSPRLLPKDLFEAKLAASRTSMLHKVRREDLLADLERVPRGRLLAHKWRFFATGILVSGSFFASLDSIALSLSYGITQLIQNRWGSAPKMKDDAGSMGFGQIMAMFLVILPPLAAVESYYDYSEIRSRHTTPAQKPAAGPPPPGDSVFIPQSPPSTGPMDAAEADVDSAYAQHLDDIKRYLALDVCRIRHLEAQQNASSAEQSDVVDRKRKMMVRYQRYKALEDSLSFSVAGAILMLLFGINIALGVLLQMRGFISILAAMYFLILVLSKLVMMGSWYIIRPTSMFEEEGDSIFSDGLSDEDGQHKGPSGATGDDRNEGVELAEMDSARRTATGLVEEGRLSQTRT